MSGRLVELPWRSHKTIFRQTFTRKVDVRLVGGEAQRAFVIDICKESRCLVGWRSVTGEASAPLDRQLQGKSMTADRSNEYI